MYLVFGNTIAVDWHFQSYISDWTLEKYIPRYIYFDIVQNFYIYKYIFIYFLPNSQNAAVMCNAIMIW